MDKIVEVMAVGMFCDTNGCGQEEWARNHHDNQHIFTSNAKAVIAALREVGYAIVPMKATEAMILAVDKVNHDHYGAAKT